MNGALKMNVVGTWKIKSAMQWDAKTMGLVEKSVEDILADPNLDDGDKKMLSAQFLFTEDGWVKTLMNCSPRESSRCSITSSFLKRRNGRKRTARSSSIRA